MSYIHEIKAREILDSRGNPTVEAEIILNTGQIGRASVPSGASTGKREALELRDNNHRYLGKGVSQAVNIINNELSKLLNGFEITHQQEIDDAMLAIDGTKNKEKLGANAILAVSLAAAKAATQYLGIPLYEYLGTQNKYFLPVPMMNVINGGAHADNNLDFQEFMIIPLGLPTFSESIRAGSEIFHHLKNLLKQKNYSTNVGDEGGFAPDLPNQEAACDFIIEAIIRAGYKPNKEICLGLDVASNELYKETHYHLKSENKQMIQEEFVDYLASFVDRYPIISIEDGMSEDDWKGWKKLTERLANRIQLVGDDLFVTNTTLLEKGIKEKVANAILIKPNQIGTLTETLAAIYLAKNNNYNTIISHRSGETEDTTIADLAVATNAMQIKTGSLSRTDRIAKYNQLIRIEERLATKATYAGRLPFSQFNFDMRLTG